jgi:chromate transporter
MSNFQTPAPSHGTSVVSEPVSLRTAFWYWLRLGCISFGGPAGQIAIMHADIVERRRCGCLRHGFYMP